MSSLFRRHAVATAACTVLVLAPASAAPALADVLETGPDQTTHVEARRDYSDPIRTVQSGLIPSLSRRRGALPETLLPDSFHSRWLSFPVTVSSG